MNHDVRNPKAATSTSAAAPEERPEPPDSRGEDEQHHDLDDDTPDPAKGNEQEAEDIARKIAEIERKVADGN